MSEFRSSIERDRREEMEAELSMVDGYDPGAYGREIANEYDDLYRAIPDTEESVDRLCALADQGAVLEMGIGTGRLALPLQARGLQVAGIEGSAEMVKVLRSKPGGDQLQIAVGDFADTRLPGTYSLVVLALHTIFGLPTPERQVVCFANAAAHLVPGGHFVLEARVVHPSDFVDGQAVQSRFSGDDHVELQVQRYEPVSQQMHVSNVHLADGRPVRINSFVNQYTSPREFDLMARMAGMRLVDRWEDWRGSAFTAHSRRHISVYQTGVAA
ncbi:MAG TPA: class I SAM-dependent methyltransferase [Solirubrobacteraceae bacterium]|nr:class I SAM-dependent methyltransferase [Solirubrobacteraceae bacterium]